MENYHLSELSESLFEGFLIDKAALLEAVSSGKIGEAIALLGEAVLKSVGNPAAQLKEYFLFLTALGIGAALLKQLELFSKDTDTKKIGFWIIYLLLAGQLVSLYYSAEAVAGECLQGLIRFGNIFVPVFSAVLTLAAGSVTGAGYIATLLLIIYIIEQFLLAVMLPIAEGYMLLCILGALWQKERVKKLAALFEKAISWGFKAIFTAVTGLGVLQSMLLPYVDRTKADAAKKIVEMLPGIGNIAGNTMELINGSTVLLKNSIGVIGILLLLLTAAVPLIKIGLICMLMKGAAVVYGLLGEKQMTWCADKLSIAEVYLWKICGTGVLLFLIWIVLAVYTTNQRLGM